MKSSAIIVLLAAFASADMLKSSCASQCVEKLSDGCGLANFQCHCAKPGLIKQLEPCLQSSCSNAEALAEAKAAFTQDCRAAGIKVSFVEPEARLEMARRADASSAAPTSTKTVARAVASASGRAGATTSRGVKPATYTGAASRDVAGSMFGFAAAAVAAAAAI